MLTVLVDAIAVAAPPAAAALTTSGALVVRACLLCGSGGTGGGQETTAGEECRTAEGVSRGEERVASVCETTPAAVAESLLLPEDASSPLHARVRRSRRQAPRSCAQCGERSREVCCRLDKVAPALALNLARGHRPTRYEFAFHSLATRGTQRSRVFVSRHLDYLGTIESSPTYARTKVTRLSPVHPSRHTLL